jgi:DNA-binding transcriptional MerR regulator
LARRYSAEELSQLTGIAQRTIRFYISQGLVPAAGGKGRGSYYTDDHLMRLVAVSEMKRTGLDLPRIRSLLELSRDLRWEDVEVWADPDWDVDRPEIASWVRAWHERLVERSRESQSSSAEAKTAPRRTAWTRLEVATGVELHVAADRTLPDAAALARIADAVRRELA